MKAFISEIRKEPALLAWLESGAWRDRFDLWTLEKAIGYIGKILSPKIGGGSDEGIVCEARVQGGRREPYFSRIRFSLVRRNWKVSAECSCPVGGCCKHSVAMILAVEYALKEPVRDDDEDLDGPLRLWLNEVAAGASAEQEAVAAKPRAENRFLAYCLEAQAFGTSVREWSFSLRQGKLEKSGEVSIPDAVAFRDPASPPKYVTRADYVAIALYFQRKKKVRSWEDMPCEGGEWEELFGEALATGRFFIAAVYAHNWIRAKSGPDIGVDAGWDPLPDGSMKPRLGFADGKPRTVLPTTPPYYIDLSSGEIGKLIGSLPPAALAAWSKAPQIPAAQVKRFSSELAAAAPHLPVPVERKRTSLPAVPPIPHLHIMKKRIPAGYGYAEVICADLQFRYGDGPLLDAPESRKGVASHVEIRADGIYTRPRDPKAEWAAVRRLISSGLVQVEEVFRSYRRQSELQHTYLPQTGTQQNPRNAWFAFLGSQERESLARDGWIFDIDPATRLVFHDAGNFFTRLDEDSAHGIEWFRFDAGFELNGRSVSLIPIIAQAIHLELPSPDAPDLPEYFFFPSDDSLEGTIRFPALRLLELVDQVRHLFRGHEGEGPLRVDRLGAAALADGLGLDDSETVRSLAQLSRNLRNIAGLSAVPVPEGVNATLRDYQKDGFQWLQFLARNALHGILADDMGLGKTVQTLTHIAAEHAVRPGRPSLVIAPTSVVPNWAAEAGKFVPHLKIISLHGKERGQRFADIPDADLVITSYALATRDFAVLEAQEWHLCVLDEAQFIKNSKAITTRNIRQLKASHRVCLSGTPMENHLGELWSLMSFLMPGYLGDEMRFNSSFRKPIERDKSTDAQHALNRRISPLILRRRKDQVLAELPAKTEIIHSIELTKKQTDLYESVRASLDKRVRSAIADKGLAKSHIIVLDALLKLRQICCHPILLKDNPAAAKAESAKLDFLSGELLPTLIEDGRRILLFSSFTSVLALIQERLEELGIRFLKLTGGTRDRALLVETFQNGDIPIFLISLKAGGTGLNLTAADTVIHYDPWWNPAAENQATDRAHRIGQTKPIFVHKLICRGSIEERILELQKHKAGLVEALLSEEISRLRIDSETLSHLLAPLEAG